MVNRRDDAPGAAPVRGAASGPTGRGAFRRVRSYLPVLLIVALTVAVFATGLHRHLSLDGLLDHRARLMEAVEHHLLLTILGIGAIYAVAVALSLPVGLALSLIAGFVLGPVLGGIVVAVSATLGATLLFLVARSSLGEALRRRAGPKLKGFASGFREDAFNYLLFLRLVPVAPFWLVNLAPALLGVSTRVFVGATALGILPATFTFTTLGAGLDSVIAAQEAANAGCVGAECRIHLDPHMLVTPGLLAGFVALGLLSLVPVAVKYWFRLRGGRR